MKNITIPDRLKSRKFILAIIAATIAFCNSFFDLGLTNEEIAEITKPFLIFIGAEGFADFAQRFNSKN